MALNQVNNTGWALLRPLAPLLVIFVFVSALAYIGYHVHASIAKIQDQAAKKIGAHNITMTKSGVSVGVRNMENERYVDATQRVVVGVWNQRVAGLEKPERKRFWSRSRKDSM